MEQAREMSLGERCHAALVACARSKAEAMRLRRKADRLFDLALLSASGKNADERRSQARLTMNVMEADEKAVEAECDAIVAKAHADGLELIFEQMRTTEATRRAEMNLR